MKESKEMTALRTELAAMTADRDAKAKDSAQWYKNYNDLSQRERARNEELEFMREIVRAAVGAPAKKDERL